MASWNNPNCYFDASLIGDPGTGKVATLKGLECIFQNIVELATGLAVVALFVMLVVGGFKFLTSSGDPKSTESAKNTLTYAIAGFFLLIVIWIILRFIYIFTGYDVTIFNIPLP